MFSIQLKLLIIAVFVGSLAIFVLQNTESMPLVLFGSTVATLPVGILLLFAILAGILTSLILQLLNQSRPQVITPVYPTAEPERVMSRGETRTRKQQGRSSTPNIDQTPAEKTKYSPKTKIQDNLNKETRQPENIENKQENPKTDTVYSYGYLKDKPKGVNKTDDVYDANYRVIIPPYQSDEQSSLDDDINENNEEDWV